MAKLHLKLVAPSTEKRTVTPTRRPNAELRTREHLTETEIEKLLKAAGTNRWGHRDGTMILVAYRHGASGRSCGPALGPNQFRHRHPARPPGQAGHTCDPSDSRRRTAGLTPATAGAGTEVGIRVHASERSSPFSTASFARIVERDLTPLSEPSPEITHQRLALRTGSRYRQRKARHNRPG